VCTQALHARIRRYTSPDEHAFFPAALPVRRARACGSGRTAAARAAKLR
jgi:hypothetical protein